MSARSVRVTALGSGDALGGGGRHASSWLVRDALGAVLVDAGPGVLQGLHRAGVDPHPPQGREGINAVHFTHLHGDHIAGWPFFLLDAIHRAHRAAPLAVTGPPGTRERLQTLWSACYPDTAQRPLGFALTCYELLPGDRLEVAGRGLEALRAQHQRPPHVALSLRLASSGGVLAFTGDTGPHHGLAALAAGARALFSECTGLEAEPGLPESEKKHLSWGELRARLPALGVRDVVLSHLGKAPRGARARIEAEGKALGHEVTVCDDGTTVHLD